MKLQEFWSNIWSNEVQFNNQAEWIPNLENEIPDSNNPHHIQISLEILVKNETVIIGYRHFTRRETIVFNITSMVKRVFTDYRNI
jgi:hypothetical protein